MQNQNPSDLFTLSELEKGQKFYEPRLSEIPINLPNLPRLVLLACIRLYQLTISRALPQNTCRFYPSCSHFGYQAIFKYGVIKGGIKAIWRILRCNPFNPGGFDPVD
jgi:putative membrane protein insertion efficiency factor